MAAPSLLSLFLVVFPVFFCCTLSALHIHKDYLEPRPHTTMSSSELEALYQVLESISGDTDWRSIHPQPCMQNAWPGVVCEQAGDASEDGIDGLMHVTRLDFGYKPNPTCMPNATFPPAIGDLPFLQSLFIFECFTETNTTIPKEIGRIGGSLKELSIRSNPALQGEIPIQIGALTSLEVLSLSQNNLHGPIPPSIGKLTNLEHLDLSYNTLTGMIPQEIGSLRNLVILDVSMNELMGPLPNAIGELTLIQKMDLSFNALEGQVPVELGNLKSLQFLSMSDNALTGPLPSSFANFTNLQYLIMDNNPVNGPIPSFLGQFSNILALTLSNSGYVGSIPEELGSLTNLSVLSLDRNNLTGPIPNGIGKLPHIYALNLSKNSLSGPVPFTPAFVHKLGRNLDLQGNSGLCSHWALPQNTTTGEIMRLCSDVEDSGYSPYPNSTAITFLSLWIHLVAAVLLAFCYTSC